MGDDTKRRSIEACLEDYGSGDRDVRIRGATDLLDLGDEAPLSVLLEILDDLHAAGLGAETERVLKRRRDAELFEAMVARLRSPSVFVQGVACGVLGELGDKAATPHLVGALESHHRLTRRAAGFALAELSDPDCVKGLKRAYRRSAGDDPNVRLAMETALNALGVVYERHPY